MRNGSEMNRLVFGTDLDLDLDQFLILTQTVRGQVFQFFQDEVSVFWASAEVCALMSALPHCFKKKLYPFLQ